MVHQYEPIASEEGQCKQERSHFEDLPEQRDRRSTPWLLFAVILLVTNTLTLGAGFILWNSKTNPKDFSDHGMNHPLSTTYEKFYWDTPYTGTDNLTYTNELWEAIHPSHGMIALDRNWAREHHLPDSMYLPDDHSKGVYLLESYHYLHCLQILRKTFSEALEGREFTYHPGSHTNHCFGALLQYIVCNADSTPLYSFGDFQAGVGQTHQCRSWSQLRQYATDNSACYRDSVEGIPLGDHFGFCDDGEDGIIELS